MPAFKGMSGPAVHSGRAQSLSLGLDTAKLALSCFRKLQGGCDSPSARQLRRLLGGKGGILAASAFASLSKRDRSRRVSAQSSARNSGFGGPRRRGTDVLMVINVAVFAAQFLSKDKLLLWGAKDNQLIRAGQWWRLITPVALHANAVHLLTNNYSLNSLGPAVEMLSGRQRFLSVYAASAVAGSAASFVFSPAASVGASGAIFGLGGALAVYCARHRDIMGKQSDAILRQLGQSLLLNIAIGMGSSRIDQWGHFGGLLGGALTAYLLGPRLERVKSDSGSAFHDNPPIPLFATKL